MPKCKPRITTVKMGETPTKERRHQNGGVMSETVARDVDDKSLVKRYRAVWECPLDVYKDRKIITEPEHRAGLRFRQAYHRTVLSRSAARERLNRYPAKEGLTMNEKLIKDAYHVVSPHNIGAVIDVCGHGQMIWSSKALESLRKGLGDLAVSWHSAAIEVSEHTTKST